MAARSPPAPCCSSAARPAPRRHGFSVCLPAIRC
ncbi:hypothetical protein R2601_02943 [Salipiger bermudensis HTCC2601]|uniref:Uncharacterized protein n=1 Tax=Salipiger bermudensis (strain DSM 26914 / JCM 13377 / KCTC 12554 / HTCC2601) TaxID=314265 RepID=Q0FWQ7_SALBH|nr:hypothetical protein R2601_02943 [Salipiger bermudensis HTCC2601]